jgi:KDO2-lipid IV(A) lauroyltransferase
VVGSFFDFIIDLASLSAGDRDALACIDEVYGVAHYKKARAGGGGAIILTAHMGSFEVGLAALATMESDVHVVFQRDQSGSFERMRRSLREGLGIHEVPVGGQGLTWLKLRTALEDNGVVVMQSDRAMVGQASVPIAVLGGTLRIPIGPIVLARLTGSPIIPVFVTRTRQGRFIVRIEPPIKPTPTRAYPVAGDQEAVGIGRALECAIKRSPDQWLMLEPAFDEDRVG